MKIKVVVEDIIIPDINIHHKIENDFLNMISSKYTDVSTQINVRPYILNYRIDMLIITALQDEFSQLKECMEELYECKHHKDSLQSSFYTYRLTDKNEEPFSVATTSLLEKGAIEAACDTTRLITELDPRCVAMIGICAGNPKSVFLGDVIVADRILNIDGSKLEVSIEQDNDNVIRIEDVFHDIKTYNLERLWKQWALNFSNEWIEKIRIKRPKSNEHQENWVLHVLYKQETGKGPAPKQHPHVDDECPDWNNTFKRLVNKGLVKKREAQLTGAGNKYVKQALLTGDIPRKDPSEPKHHVGPVGTTNRVQKDPQLFERLNRISDKILGIEMEGIGIAIAAEKYKRPMIMVKAVSDYGDSDKNDMFRHYAAEASARFFMEFITL